MKKTKFNIIENNDFGGMEIEIFSPETTIGKTKSNIFLKLLMGAIIGFVNGFWGGGGGMLCVPLLIQVLKLPEKNAHATTLLIMLPLSIASLLIYIFRGSMPWFDAGVIGLGFVVGGILGAIILKFINNIWLGLFFGVVIIVGGIKMLV